MPADPTIALRSATSHDAAFIVEMARHACVIEDWPLPAADSAEVRELHPSPGEIPIVAVGADGARVGAVWTFHSDPPLRVDGADAATPELCIAVVPGRRGSGVGGLLMDALFTQKSVTMAAMCINVHVRNPAKRLYERKGFRVVGQGRGPLGVAMVKDLR